MTEVEAATEQRLASVPSLDDIARDPGCAGGLPPRTLAALQSRAAVVQAALAAEALAAAIEPGAQPATAAQEESAKMLTVDEAAAMLRRSRQWIYRQAPHLPFVKRISRKSLLCSEAGIKRWLATRKA
jgi:predicted DNA-binding transcriptional regulator AlpA